MRAFTIGMVVFLFGVTPIAAQESAETQPYDDADAYQIYSLLLPMEESYGFARDELMVQENTVAPDISAACLKQPDARRFRGAIAGYDRISKKSWVLQRRFQIPKAYKIVSANRLPAIHDLSQSAVSYLSMSPVGFNRERTQAVVFVKSRCGRLCGSWRFHFLEKVHGKWKEIPLAICVGAS